MIWRFAENFAHDAADTDDVKSEKIAIFLVATSCCVAGVVWTAMYLAAFGIGLTAALPLLFVLVVGSSLVYAHLSRNYRFAIYTQIVCIIYITAFIQWNIGDVFDSGFVMAWAFMGPLIALMFFSVRQAALWQGLFLVNVVITVAFSDFFAARSPVVSHGWRLLFFAMNLGFASTVVFAFAAYFVRNALNEKQKADRLLLNILPSRIAETLKSQEGVIADEFESVSVLFADIVNYTAYASDQSPAKVVSKLNEIFNCFDELADRHGLEKIKTIGDAYMVIGGAPVAHQRHCHAIAEMALDMMAVVGEVATDGGEPFSLRIGIHAGPVVAGVIGHKKFAYDLWGDTVNLASRLESSGLPGQIQASEALYLYLKDDFQFERRGKIELKGKGEVDAYILIGRKDRVSNGR